MRWKDMLSEWLLLKLQEDIPDLIYHQDRARPPFHNERRLTYKKVCLIVGSVVEVPLNGLRDRQV